MRVAFFLFAMFTLQSVTAANYYFSNNSGDDNRSSLQAQNPATPWKTVNKLNGLALSPGDSVLFKRGEVFYGTLNVNASGSAGSAITYGAYGTGANPKISGFTSLKTWTNEGNGIYSTPLINAPKLNLVTVNGQAKEMGRYPNTGYLSYESHTGNTSITDNQLPASPAWTGAEIAIRKYRYVTDRHVVTAHSGNRLTYATSNTYGNNSHYSPVDLNGYFIQDHLQTLDLFGEWFYDDAAGKFYMYFGGSLPGNYEVKTTTTAYNINVNTKKHITFVNLDFEGAAHHGVYLITADTFSFINCNSNLQGGNAFYGNTVTNFSILGGSINNSLNNGISLESQVANCTITGLTVSNTALFPGAMRSGDGMGIGINIYGNGTTIRNCIVKSTGYIGIGFQGSNVLIEKNFVDDFCKVKDDGAGIYTVGGAGPQTNQIIRANIITNGRSALAGMAGDTWAQYGKGAGIYIDDFATNVEISNNSIAHCSWSGILNHNASSLKILNNTVYNNSAQFHFLQDAAGNIRNNTWSGNIFFSKLASQPTLYFWTLADDQVSSFGLGDNNYYARPIDDNATLTVEIANTNSSSNLSLSQWKSTFRTDANSNTSPLTIPANPDEHIRYEYNATNANKTVSLDGSYTDVRNIKYSGSIVLKPYSSAVLLKQPDVAKTNQTITFNALAAKTEGDAPFALSATASSGLPVSFRIVSGPATLAANVVTLTGAGTVVVEASQAGNTAFNAAATVKQSFEVTKVDATDTNAPIQSDTTPPSIITRNITVPADVNGQAIIKPADVIQSVTDNSEVDNASLQLSQTQFSCSPTSSTGATVAASYQAYKASTKLGNQDFGGELGLTFKVNTPGGIVIKQLGAFDHQGNGITGTQSGGVRVAVFNKATKTIVPGLNVVVTGTADAYSGNHRMKNITPVTLAPGEYVLVAKGYHAGELNGNCGGGTPYPAGELANGAISYGSAGLYGAPGSGFAYPANPDGGPGNIYLAGTFSYSLAGSSTTSNTTSTVTVTVKDIHGNIGQATATVTIDCSQLNQTQYLRTTTASEEPLIGEENKLLSIYPNPTKGNFTLQLSGLHVAEVAIEIITTNGLVIAKKTVRLPDGSNTLEQNFDLSNQPSGLYLVKVISADKVQVGKVIIQP